MVIFHMLNSQRVRMGATFCGDIPRSTAVHQDVHEWTWPMKYRWLSYQYYQWWFPMAMSEDSHKKNRLSISARYLPIFFLAEVAMDFRPQKPSAGWLPSGDFHGRRGKSWGDSGTSEILDSIRIEKFGLRLRWKICSMAGASTMDFPCSTKLHLLDDPLSSWISSCRPWPWPPNQKYIHFDYATVAYIPHLKLLKITTQFP